MGRDPTDHWLPCLPACPRPALPFAACGHRKRSAVPELGAGRIPFGGEGSFSYPEANGWKMGKYPNKIAATVPVAVSASGWRAAFAGLACALWMLAPHCAEADGLIKGATNVSTLDFCYGNARLTALSLTSEDDALIASPICVDDALAQQTHKPPRRATVHAPRGTPVPRSVFSIDSAETFDVVTTLEPEAQVVEVAFRDGRRCARVAATARKRGPVPDRFLPTSRDWRQSIDYMVDANCTVLLVRVGNRVSVAPVAGPAAFDLYGIRFNLR